MNIEASTRSSNESDRAPIEIVLVTTPRCHFCDDASKLLNDLANEYPLRVRKIDLANEEGTAIASRYRIPFPPVLIVSGTYFGHGRISRRKLVRALDEAVRLLAPASDPYRKG